MAQQNLNIGSQANDGTGDTLRTTGQKVNANFTEVYGLLQSAGGAVRFGKTSMAPVTYTGSESVSSNTLVFAKKASAFSLSIPNGTVDGEIKIFVNTGSAPFTINATSSNLNTPGGGSIVISSGGSCMLVWDATAPAAWYMLSTDINSSTVTS